MIYSIITLLHLSLTLHQKKKTLMQSIWLGSILRFDMHANFPIKPCCDKTTTLLILLWIPGLLPYLIRFCLLPLPLLHQAPHRKFEINNIKYKDGVFHQRFPSITDKESLLCLDFKKQCVFKISRLRILIASLGFIWSR